jgi:hypothetical protein
MKKLLLVLFLFWGAGIASAQVWVCDAPSCTAWEADWPYASHDFNDGDIIDEDYDDLLPTQPPYHDEEPEDNGWLPLGGYGNPYDPQHQPPLIPWWFPCLVGCVPLSNTAMPVNPAWMGVQIPPPVSPLMGYGYF